jgi:flagellin-specific chaperone FliS
LVKIYEGCLRALSANAVHLSQLHKDGEEIQLKIEELARSQEVLSGLMKTMEENGEEDTEELDASMKRIKNEKDALDLRTRELRTSEKLCEDLEKVLPG